MPKNLTKKQISWAIQIPLVTNKDIFWQTTLTCLITYLVMVLLFSFLMFVQKELVTLPSLLLMMLAVVFILWILMFLVMLVVFANHLPMVFAVSSRGVIAQMTSHIGQQANRAAIILGLLTGKMSAVGSGLTALSRETVNYSWKDITRVKFDQSRRVIVLANSWRPLLYLYCLPDNYRAVVQLVKTYYRPRKLINPLPHFLVQTVLIFLACLPVFVLDYPFQIHLFLAIFLLCFAQAALWLIPIFGYVVIGTVLLVIGIILQQGLTTHQSIYSSLGTYTGFSILNAEEWLGMGVVAIGLVYLIYLSWRLIKGKEKSALFSE